MSRCFPFPPPGYELKNAHYLELLAKEREKGTNHKKEKTHKERKHNDRRHKHKDRRRHKHEDRKNQKERHRDKKREKVNNIKSDDREISDQNCKIKDKNVISRISKVVEHKEHTFTEEFVRKIALEKKAASGRMLENSTSMLPKRVESLIASETKRVSKNCIINHKIPTDANCIIKEQRRANRASQPIEMNTHDHQVLCHDGMLPSNFMSNNEPRRVYGIPQGVEKKNEMTGKVDIKSICNGHVHSLRNIKREDKEKEECIKREKRKEEEKKREKNKIRNGEIFETPRIKDARLQGNSGDNKKRKEIEINGLFHENEVPNNKFLRCGSSSHQLNGKASEVEHSRTNKIKGEILFKPPHPDSKYLSQIYHVQKMDVLPEIDDQEWLRSSTNCELKKFETETTVQVFDQELKIDYADIFALPYVIPY